MEHPEPTGSGGAAPTSDLQHRPGHPPGEVSTEPSDASATLLADSDGRWDDVLLAELGVRRDLLPEVAGSAEVSGQLIPRSQNRDSWSEAGCDQGGVVLL